LLQALLSPKIPLRLNKNVTGNFSACQGFSAIAWISLALGQGHRTATRFPIQLWTFALLFNGELAVVRDNT